MAEIQLNNVSKAFPDRTVAVHALDITVADGEFLSLLGPSGCGKSTLLRMIAGLEGLTNGAISFDGHRVDHLAPGKRNVSMVFQNYALYPHMSVRENLAYPLKKHGVAAPERKRRAEEVARTLHMEELLDRRPRQLSGGQQQRVALGRAMIRQPSVFLLDEPLSNLDAQLRVTMRSELIRLHKSISQTMIYVTHDQLEAMTMSDRIAVLNKGLLQQIGTPKVIYRCPANRFVAGFVGTPAMNFFPGEIAASAGQGRILCALGAIDVHPDRLTKVQSSRCNVEIGVRAEDIAITSGQPNARVTMIEMTGHETLVVLDASGFDVTTRVSADSTLKSGDMVHLALDERSLHLFDPATGDRIAGWN